MTTPDTSEKRPSPHPGLLTVISGPSGVGKTSIVAAVRERLDGVFSVSATTRAPAAGERDGVDYHFLDEPRFQAMIDADEFLEYAQVFGRDWYGTPRGWVDGALTEGKLVILDIDVQGGLQVRERAPGAFMIFVLPPSEEALLQRLRGRARDSEEAIQRRFAEARREIELARSSDAYDAYIVNDDLARAQDETCELIRARRRVSVGQ